MRDFLLSPNIFLIVSLFLSSIEVVSPDEKEQRSSSGETENKTKKPDYKEDL